MLDIKENLALFLSAFSKHGTGGCQQIPISVINPTLPSKEATRFNLLSSKDSRLDKKNMSRTGNDLWPPFRFLVARSSEQSSCIQTGLNRISNLEKIASFELQSCRPKKLVSTHFTNSQSPGRERLVTPAAFQYCGQRIVNQ